MEGKGADRGVPSPQPSPRTGEGEEGEEEDEDEGEAFGGDVSYTSRGMRKLMVRSMEGTLGL